MREPRREAVSIVCVWNDEDVRSRCLDASIEALRQTAPRTEYLPVDNRGQVHATAGAALNSGVRRASNDVVVLVHQDVHLHSLVALERAAGLLADDASLGLLGAVGITADGRVVGRTRDRVLLLGTSAPTPVDVDSLDEVLFLARRADLLAGPVSEHPDLAWHAYAVELGMRERSRGRRVAALDLPLTHNSLSTNLARLDHAHAALARMYPALVPTRTTCGDVSSPTPSSEARRPLAAHRWRARWLRASLAARRAAAVSGPCGLVLADIRTDLDRVTTSLGVDRLRVLNVVADESSRVGAGRTTLRRGALEVEFRCVTPDDVELVDPARRHDRPTLVTNLAVGDLRALSLRADELLGLHESLGHWLLTGVDVDVAALWPAPRHRPWGALVRQVDRRPATRSRPLGKAAL